MLRLKNRGVPAETLFKKNKQCSDCPNDNSMSFIYLLLVFCIFRFAFCIPRSAFCVSRSASCILRSAFCVKRSAFLSASYIRSFHHFGTLFCLFVTFFCIY